MSLLSTFSLLCNQQLIIWRKKCRNIFGGRRAFLERTSNPHYCDEAALKNYPEALVASKCNCPHGFVQTWVCTCVTCPVGAALVANFFLGAIQGVVFKLLHSLGLGYMRKLLLPVTPVLPRRAGRQRMLQVSSPKELHLAGPRKRVFSVVAPSHWNITPTHTLTLFCIVSPWTFASRSQSGM